MSNYRTRFDPTKRSQRGKPHRLLGLLGARVRLELVSIRLAGIRCSASLSNLPSAVMRLVASAYVKQTGPWDVAVAILPAKISANRCLLEIVAATSYGLKALISQASNGPCNLVSKCSIGTMRFCGESSSHRRCFLPRLCYCTKHRSIHMRTRD